MPRRRFIIADVFTDQPFGGNQLAVLPDGSGLSTEQMRRIAREFNFSETVFAIRPEKERGAWGLRIFTPAAEMPFAGHPTIGAAVVLASLKEVPLNKGRGRIVFDEGVGPVKVSIEMARGRAGFAQLTAAVLPQFGPPLPPLSRALASMLSLEVQEMRNDEFEPQIVSCGVPFTFIPLRDLEAVRRARLDQSHWQRTLAKTAAPKVFIFAMQGQRAGSDVHGRMFAPSLGIAEDPATGAAAAALAGYLAARDGRDDGTLGWTIEQGFEIGRPSLLFIEADKRSGQIAAVRVGGHAVLIAEGQIDEPGE